MDNYCVYHLHSDLSTGVTNIDSVTKYKTYIEKARKCGMTALAFSEHGNVFEWYHKKCDIEAAGMKYIHAIEAYITESLTEKIRDNYHCVLIARNYEGFKEINKLSSASFNRDDGHFYYVPRISIDELLATSENIMVTTACLGGILNNGTLEMKDKFLEFLIRNKERCFLEIQHHIEEDQKAYNLELVEISNKTGIPLIAGTDTHALNDEHLEARKVLQKAKDVHFANEDAWDLTFKTYDELIKAYERQGVLSKEVYISAINNTNKIADMVEEFDIDTSHKYPVLYKDSERVFAKKILNGVKRRGIDKLPNKQEYLDRIKSEIETYKHNGAIDFMLLEEDYKAAMRKKGIYPGYSRGSVSGSIIAYLLGITEVDSIKHGLNFERFMNTERVSLPDIDSDWYDEDRDEVKKYLYSKKGLYCCDIITFNTIKLKGAVRDICRGLFKTDDDNNRGYLNMTNEIIDLIRENKEEVAREKFPMVFKFVDIVQDVIVSVGNHPAGVVVSPFPVDDWFATFTSSNNKYSISQINMKEIDSLNFVKLDVLGLANIGLINKTCEMAGIERLTPNNTPLKKEVFESIRDDTTCIFQWESNSAQSYLKRLLSDETIEKIREANPDFSYMDLLSIGNGAIRPAGASYRDELAKGEFRDNGHEALNEMLASTQGFLVFQEQVLKFLHEFCGYTMGEADVVRRHFAKKTGTERDIPQIKAGFIKTMKEKYGVDEAESEKLIVNFLRVIEDASDYLFSLNHSDPYSWIGYICGYLRYHYPYEFLTTALNIFEDDEEKSLKIIEYIQKVGIKLNSIKFRHSLSEYTFSKEDKAIFKGMKSIKYLNKKLSRELYALRNNEYADFYALLEDINHKTSVDSRQLTILIELDFFSEFGNPNQLLYQSSLYAANIGKKHINKKSLTDVEVEAIKNIKHVEKPNTFVIEDSLELIRALDDSKDIKTSLREMLDYESEHLGYIGMILPSISAEYAYVTDVNKKYKNKIVKLYRLNSGLTETVKVKAATYDRHPIEKGMIIKTIESSLERKWKMMDGKFYQIDEREVILKKWCEVT